jgi:DNA-binding NarL/FixJ family response regulator
MKSEKLTAFVIDDDNFYSSLIGNWLFEKYLANVSKFETAEQCLKKLTDKPDIIFLDYNLFQEDKQNINGNVALKTFLTENPKLKIVMVSSDDDDKKKKETIDSGAYAYLVKDKNTIHSIQEIMNSIVNYKKYLKKYENIVFED